MMKYIQIILIFLFINLPLNSFSGIPFGDFEKDNPNKPWHIVADEVSYDNKTNTYVVKGNVHITKEHKKINADYVRFDYDKMKVFAKGHVIMTAGHDIINADRINMDLNAETGTIYDGTIFIKENHFYITGDKIKKIGKKQFTAKKVSITSCDGDSPAWKITGRDLDVTMEEYGTMSHATFWVKDTVPTLYFPYLIFPAKQKRQTGFLFPLFGYSDRWGINYSQPFFWAIDKSSDATINSHAMINRGEKLGLEYRYVLSDENNCNNLNKLSFPMISKGTIMFDYFYDTKTSADDGLNVERSSNLVRPNHNRYWLRAKANQDLPYGIMSKIDIDIVSDQDYLFEFENSPTGYNDTNDYFVKNFGRGINDYENYTRTNDLIFTKLWNNYSLNLEVAWYDNVVVREKDNPSYVSNTSLQRIPSLTIDGTKQKLYNTPLYFELDGNYSYLYRDSGGAALEGSRAYANPKLSLPYKFGQYLNIEPSVWIDETIWYIDKYENPNNYNKNFYNRQIATSNINLFTEVFKVYPFNFLNVDKIKHLVTPAITYTYTPRVNQSELPYFTSTDRIGKNNAITYSLTNRFTTRSLKSSSQKTDKNKKKNAPPQYEYNQFGYLRFWQTYNINEAKEEVPSKWRIRDNKQPFSPINAELTITPASYVNLKSTTSWSLIENKFNYFNLRAEFINTIGDGLYIDYVNNYSESSKKITSQNINFNFNVGIFEWFRIYGSLNRNLLDDENIGSNFGFYYKSQCWGIIAGYNTSENGDNSYSFSVVLHGLGGIGSGGASYTQYQRQF